MHDGGINEESFGTSKAWSATTEFIGKICVYIWYYTPGIFAGV